MYRKYYSINDMPQLRNVDEVREIKKETTTKAKNIEEQIGFIKDGRVFGKFEIDDIILIIIALVLFADDCDDKLLLFALVFIFLSGVL